jgi:hypothetical protein
MPTVIIDFPETNHESISSTQTDGTSFETSGYVIQVVIPDEEVQEWLSLYDPTSGTSPSAANSRIIARAVLEALRVTVDP